MSFLSHLFNKKDEHVLVLDIGSASVTGAFITLQNNNVVITASATSEIKVLPEVEPLRFEKEMEEALNRVLSMLKKITHTKPQHISVYLSSPWYTSQVRVAKISRKTPFVVTKKMLDDVVARELKAFEAETRKHTEGSQEELKTIESKLVGVTLNGYMVDDPVGVSARDLELSIFLSIAPMRTLSGIKKLVMDKCSHASIDFGSFLGAAYIVLRDHLHQEQDYLFVDIGGEVTDVTLVRDGVPRRTVSFPRGRNFMLRSLSKGLNRSITESVSICRLYMEGKVEESLRASCEKILTNTKNEWLESFQEAIFSVSNELSLPDTLCLACQDDVTPWFSEVVKREEFHQYTLTEKEFNVIILNAAFFNDMLIHTDGALRNPFVMIEALVSGHHHWYKKKRETIYV